MCNAWNHVPGCNCGWGGSGSSYNLSTPGSRLVGYSRIVGDYGNSFSSRIENAETYPTRCRWCKASVYYHTNGYGDSVLFDSLGWPWQVHSCWSEYWTKEKARRNAIQPIILRNLEPNQLKRLVLAGAIQKAQHKGSIATEETVASQMGVSVEQLRRDYNHLYELYMESKVIRMRLQ